MLRAVPSVALANTSSRSSVNSDVDKRSAPYASSKPTGTTSSAAVLPGLMDMSSTRFFSNSGTLTLATLAPTKNKSAKPTRQRYCHR